MQLTEVTIFCMFFTGSVGSTVRYGKSDNWMIETGYSKLKVGNLL